MQATMVNFLELLPVVLVSIAIATFITRESHNGGLKWMDSNHNGRFAMTGPEGSEEDGQRSQEKPGNVSTDGDLVFVVTINITQGRETGFTVPSAHDRDALEAESTVVYRSITNWFPKMRLTSEETIARCTVELPLRVLSLALAQTMKKRTPAHFVNVNPQYQQQHLHFRRNRRCG
uniref:Uncharacterized protein n=1 Tax=Branchiostoma floridae TaxID=7739 RepID=C3Y1E2_BRAFL|eukprot:XP_002609672.1 hypothetical protein BRAFLDRAFT_83676 [Branchiostoma floridae]